MSEENKLITIFEFEDADASQKVEKTVKSIERLKIELEEVSSPLDKASQKIKEEGDAAEVATVKLTGLAAAQKRMQDAASAASSSSSPSSLGSPNTIGLTDAEFNEVKRIHAEKQRMAEQEDQQVRQIHETKSRLSDSEFNEIQKIHSDKEKAVEAERVLVSKAANADFVEIQKIHAFKISQQETEAKALAKAAEADLKGIAMRGRVQAQYAEQAAKAGVKYGEEIVKGGTSVERGAKSATAALNQLFVAGTNLGRGLSRAGGEVEALGGPLMGLGYTGLAASRGISALAAVGPELLVFGGVVAALAGTAAIFGALDLAAVKTAQSFGNFGDKIFKAEKETGLTARTLETLYVVSEETGKSFDTFALSTARLGANIDKGLTSKTNDAHKSLQLLATEGLDIATLGAKSMDEQLYSVAQALEKIPNQNDKARAASALFGKGIFQNAAAVDEFANGIIKAHEKLDAFGLNLSDQQVQAAHDFEVALRDLGMGFEGLAVTAGKQAAPAIISALEEIGTALGFNESSWVSWGNTIGSVLAAAITGSVRAAGDIATAIKSIPLVMFGGPLGTFIAGKNIYDKDKQGEKWQAEVLLSAAINANPDQYMGGDASFGKGVLPDKNHGIEFKPSGGGKGKKGTDPARIEEQLAKEQLKATELDLQAQENALNNSLHRRVVSLQEYTDQARQLEIERHKAVLAGLEKEKSVAESFKDPKKRAVEVQKVNNAIAAEDEKYNQKRRELTNKTDDDEIARARATRESVLSIDEIKNKGLEQRLASYVQAGIKTHEFSAREEKRIMLETSSAKEENLRRDIQDAGADVAQKEKLQEDIRKLIAQRAVDEENAYQKIKEARAQDIISMLEQQKTIEDINSRRDSLNRDSLAISLNIMTMDGVYREKMIRQQAKLEADAEKERERLAVSGLQRDIQILETKRIALQINGQQALEQERVLSAEIESIKSNSSKKIEEINAKLAKQITDHWKDVANDISNVLQDGIEKGWKGVFDDFKTMLFQINKELMSSLLMQILHPQQKQGTTTGGIAGTILSSIFGIFNKKSGAQDAGMHPTKDHAGEIDINTKALEHLAGKVTESGVHIVDDIASTVTDVTATGVNTGSVSINTAALDVNTAALEQLTLILDASGIGSDSSGLSGLFSGLFNNGGVPIPSNDLANSFLDSFSGLAEGGPFQSNSWHVMGEKGPELVYTGPHSGMVIPNNVAFGNLNGNGGGNTYITNVNMPQRPKSSYQQPRSDREQAEQIAAAISRRIE